MAQKKRTWETNAREFAELDEGKGWPFARLVACSVTLDAGNGRPPKTSPRGEVSGKVGAYAFAKAAGTKDTRIARFLKAWDAAADKGLVPHSSTLRPADVPKVPLPDVPWDAHYTESNAGYNDRDRLNSAVRKAPPEAIIAALSSVQRAAVIGAAAPEEVVAAVPAEHLAPVAKEVIRVSDPDQFDAVRRTATKRWEEEHAESLAKMREADRKAEEARRARHSMAWLSMDVLITAARGKVRDAINEARGVQFTDEERQWLAAAIAKLRAAVDFLDVAVAGQSANVDWDAELAKMGEK